MRKTIPLILLTAFSVLLAVSGYFIISDHKEAAEVSNMYDSLAELVDKASTASDVTEPDTELITDSDGESKAVLVDYSELYAQNSDMVGWIRIEDTNINFPVMQSPENPDFYLKHGFDKGYSDYGCPYVQENCDVLTPSDNVVIYGHHMKNGAMFADLEKFKSEEFWADHKTFTFDTLTEHHEYEIVAVFKTFVYSDSEASFKYYRFVNAVTKQDFEDYIATCKTLSFYDTGVNAEYGDKLVSLSTCEYSRSNGRLVVVGRLITEP